VTVKGGDLFRASSQMAQDHLRQELKEQGAKTSKDDNNDYALAAN